MNYKKWLYTLFCSSRKPNCTHLYESLRSAFIKCAIRFFLDSFPDEQNNLYCQSQMVYIPLGPIVCNPDVIPKSEIYSIHVKCYVEKNYTFLFFKYLTNTLYPYKIWQLGTRFDLKHSRILIVLLMRYHTNVTCRHLAGKWGNKDCLPFIFLNFLLSFISFFG